MGLGFTLQPLAPASGAQLWGPAVQEAGARLVEAASWAAALPEPDLSQPAGAEQGLRRGHGKRQTCTCHRHHRPSGCPGLVSLCHPLSMQPDGQQLGPAQSGEPSEPRPLAEGRVGPIIWRVGCVHLLSEGTPGGLVGLSCLC